jgi:hypothetical protein
MNYSLLEQFDAELSAKNLEGFRYSAGRAPSRVLALHPDLDLSRVRNWTVGCS